MRLLGFDEGSPDGNDPLQLARAMASRGITLVSYTLVKLCACYGLNVLNTVVLRCM